MKHTKLLYLSFLCIMGANAITISQKTLTLMDQMENATTTPDHKTYVTIGNAFTKALILKGTITENNAVNRLETAKKSPNTAAAQYALIFQDSKDIKKDIEGKTGDNEKWVYALSRPIVELFGAANADIDLLSSIENQNSVQAFFDIQTIYLGNNFLGDEKVHMKHSVSAMLNEELPKSSSSSKQSSDHSPTSVEVKEKKYFLGDLKRSNIPDIIYGLYQDINAKSDLWKLHATLGIFELVNIQIKNQQENKYLAGFKTFWKLAAIGIPVGIGTTLVGYAGFTLAWDRFKSDRPDAAHALDNLVKVFNNDSAVTNIINNG